MASTYYDDVDFESFSFDQDPLSPVWTHSDYDNQMSGMDTFWQNMGLPTEQQQLQHHHLQHQSLQHNPQLLHQQHAPQHIQQHHTHQQQYNVQSQDTDAMTDNFSNHQQHQPQVHQPQVHNGWSHTTNMMYIKQEVKQEIEQPQQQQHHTQPQQYGYYSSSSSQNSYDSSFSASTDSDAEFEDSQQSTSWEQPQQLHQQLHQQHAHHQHQQHHYSYPSETEHSMNSQTHSELMYIKPEMKQETNGNTLAYSPDPHGSEDNSWAAEETISFMADDENDPVDFKLPASKTPIMEAMVVCAINNWGISVIKSTPGEVIFKVLDFDRYYRISRSICSKHRPTEDIGSRVKSLRRWFTNFPKKKDRQENPQFFLSVKPNTCKKVHGLIDRNTKLLNAQRKAR